jgi:hypothetical protein
VKRLPALPQDHQKISFLARAEETRCTKAAMKTREILGVHPRDLI